MAWNEYDSSTVAGTSSPIAGEEGAVLVSASTVTLTDSYHQISGTTQINTFTYAGGTDRGIFLVRPTGAFPIGTSGNIKSAPATAVVDAVMLFWYDGTNFYYMTSVIGANAVTDGALRDSVALSVIGRSANSTGDPADIAAASDGNVLRRSGTTLGFGAVNLAGGAAAVTGTLPVASGGTGVTTSTGSGSNVLSASPTLTGAPVLADPTATTIQTSGNVGIGVAPSGTAGVRLTATDNNDNNSIARITNSNASGTSANAILRSEADVAMLAVIAHGSGRVVSRAGVTVGGWSELLAASGNGILLGTLNAVPVRIYTNGTAAIVLDGTTGQVTVQEATGNVKAKGYTVTDGGTVTQATNITTGVTLNTTTGQITTVTGPSIAAGAEVAFTVTNSTIATTSVIIVNVATQFSDGDVIAAVQSIASGSFVIKLTNVSTAAVSAGAAVINFAVFGGSAT